MDYSLSGSSDHGISQTRILEWGAISFSSRSSWSRDPMHLSCLAGDSLTLSHLGSPLKKERVIYFILNLQQLKEAQYFISFFWVLVRLYKTCFGNTPLIYFPCDSEGCHFWEHTAAVSGCGSGGIYEVWYEDASWGSSQIMIGVSQCWSFGSGKKGISL